MSKWLEIIRNLSSHEKINSSLTTLILIATVINAGATVVYVRYVKKSNEAATHQTSQLIAAANVQASAATRNADSAASMATSASQQAAYSKSIADQTLAQAKATNDLARQAALSANTAKEALQSNIELSREDRRAWVGLQGFQCAGCSIDQAGFAIIVRDFSGIVVNTGKTPALKMQIKTVFMNGKRGAPIPDWDTVQKETSPPQPTISPNLPPDAKNSILKTMEIINRESVEMEAMPPNAVRTFTVPSARFEREKVTPMEDQVVIYILGKISYYDTKLDKQHSTWFCLMNVHGDGFHFCPSGNDMD
jgi:hypothetical protein